MYFRQLLILTSPWNLIDSPLQVLPFALIYGLMQVKLDQEKQKEILLTGGRSNGSQTLEQESERIAKLRADALKPSTSEPSNSKEPESEGVFLSPRSTVHVYLISLSASFRELRS